MGTADRIYANRSCTVDGLDGLFKVCYWFRNPNSQMIVWVKGGDEQGKLLCSLDPSGTLGIERKDIHWIPQLGDTLC